MTRTQRRAFLKQAAAATAGWWILQDSRSAWTALAALVVVALAATGVRALARERDETQRLDTFLRDMWDHLPMTHGYVIWNQDLSARGRLYQLLDHDRPDLTIVVPRQLMDEDTRLRFAHAHGFDPLAGAAPPTEAEADLPITRERFRDQIADGIAASQPDSVVLFLPEEPSIRLVPRPTTTR